LLVRTRVEGLQCRGDAQGAGDTPGYKMRLSLVSLAACAVISLVPSVAVADDWIASKVRGDVLQWADGQWVHLRRGDVVPDDRVLRTLAGGRMTLERGNEVIELSSQTQIRILDKPGRLYTTVKQDFGKVTVQADVRQVEHFAVQTPLLAAVVKGTKFTVVSGKHSAEVSVQRGHVAVEDSDTHQTTVLAAGESVTTEDGGAPLLVAGHGKSPVVFGEDGKPVSVPGRGKGSENGNGPDKAGTAGSNADRSEGGNGNSGGDNSSNSNAGGNGNGRN